MSGRTDAVVDLAVHTRKHHTPQPGCDWCPEVEMTAPTDHLAAAREALDDFRGEVGLDVAALHLCLAQTHATLALAEEARTTNLIRSLDYGCGPLDRSSRDRLDEITARLWGTT